MNDWRRFFGKRETPLSLKISISIFWTRWRRLRLYLENGSRSNMSKCLFYKWFWDPCYCMERDSIREVEDRLGDFFGLQIAASFLVPLLCICCAGAGRFPVSCSVLVCCVAACYVYAFWRMTVNGMHVYNLFA